MSSLRPYQSEALQVSKDKFDAGITRQLIQLPTGTGKTMLFANLKQHHCFENREIVLVHREELADQAAEKIRHWNPSFKVGIEMGEKECSNNDDVIVASVPTIGCEGSTRIKKFKPNFFDSLTADEAHHAVASTWQRVFNYFGVGGNNPATNRLLLGVTATPSRGDGQGLGQVFDEIIYRMSIMDAIRDGWLVDVRGYRISTNTDLSGVSVRAGDFAINQLEEAVNTDARNHLIVQNWLAKGENRSTVAFCVDIAHSKRLAEVFKGYGVAAEAVWGNDPDRADKLKFHRLGHLKVLTNCGVLVEGYDDWRISCIIMARPTKSQLLFVQMAGRGTRIPSDINNLLEARALGLTITKEDCLLMDVVDNTGRHSLVTLASLFGLGAKTDFKGKTITYAQAEVDAAKEKHPNLDLSQIDNLDDIQATVERVNLFEVKWEPEVISGSALKWTKNSKGDYVINLPANESVTIFQDLLDKWNIKGAVLGNKFLLEGIHALEEAFRVADDFVQRHGRGLLTLLRREQKWHKAKASLPQKNLLRKFYKYEPNVLAQLETISRGEAAALIDKKIHNTVKPVKVGV
jgi:ATP-dependent helicase IRC3